MVINVRLGIGGGGGCEHLFVCPEAGTNG